MTVYKAKLFRYFHPCRILLTSIEEPSWLEIGDRERRSPLHVAVAAAACESARLLMEAGADPNARGIRDDT